jgi:hypothetical protein
VAADGSVGARSADVKVASGATRSLAPTPGTWADSQVSVAAFKPRPRSKLIPLLGLGIGVLVAGGAFAFFRSGGDAPKGAAASSNAPAQSIDAKNTAAPPTPTPTPSADDFKVAVPAVSPDAVKALLEPATPAPPAPAAPAPKPAAVVPVKKVPAASPVTKKAAPPAAPASPPATATSKRKRDFGY